VLYVPNQGHGLRDVDRVIGALSAVHRYSSAARALPQLSWESTATQSMKFVVSADRPPTRVWIWTANSATRDFREAHWSARPCKRNRDSYTCIAPRAMREHTAAYAEAAFADGRDLKFSLSTTVCIVGPQTEANAADC
jgi:PhoPQ-activated pathogenicity-related protein